jgi:mRNA interferase MazF
MPPTTVYDFGDIILVPFPFTDQSAIKKRPAVVVGSKTYSLNLPDIVLMAVTTQIKPLVVFGETMLSQWQLAGLLKPWVIKPVFTTIEKSLVLKKLGRLSQQDMAALRVTIQNIIG